MVKRLWIPIAVVAILLGQLGVALAVVEWRGEAGPSGPAGVPGVIGPQGPADASSCQAEMYDRLIKEKSSDVARAQAASACGEGRSRTIINR